MHFRYSETKTLRIRPHRRTFDQKKKKMCTAPSINLPLPVPFENSLFKLLFNKLHSVEIAPTFSPFKYVQFRYNQVLVSHTRISQSKNIVNETAIECVCELTWTLLCMDVNSTLIWQLAPNKTQSPFTKFALSCMNHYRGRVDSGCMQYSDCINNNFISVEPHHINEWRTLRPFTIQQVFDSNIVFVFPLSEIKYSENSYVFYTVVNSMLVRLWCCATNDASFGSLPLFVQVESILRISWSARGAHSVLYERTCVRLIVCVDVFGCSNYEKVNVPPFVSIVPNMEHSDRWHWYDNGRRSHNETAETVEWFNLKIVARERRIVQAKANSIRFIAHWGPYTGSASVFWRWNFILNS